MSRAKDRLRGKGIAACEVSASRVILVPHTALVMAKPDDPLFDPRSLDPVDEVMAQDMAERVQAGKHPNTDALYVWERPGFEGLLVGDGHGRTKSLFRAADILGLTGAAHLMVLVEFHLGDEKDFLLERARRNDPNKIRPDSLAVLAFRVRQLTAIGATEREIADACPRGVGPAEVEALTRWANLAADARQRFEDGVFPLGILAAVLEAPKGEQVARGEKLVAAGVRTGRAATKRANEERASRDPWARRMSPKVLLDVAALLLARPDQRDPVIAARAQGLAEGLALAANAGAAPGILDTLPKPLADLIREARAAKPAKGARS